MNTKTWDLSPLYPSFQSPEFRKDQEILSKKISEVNTWSKENFSNTQNAAQKLEWYLAFQNDLGDLFSRLSDYAFLTLSTDTENETAIKLCDILEDTLTELTESNTAFEKWVCSLGSLTSLFLKSSFLQEHQYYLEQIQNQGQYLLSEQEELLLARMKTTGSSAWGRLQEQLTATLKINLTLSGENKTFPLATVRNLAYSPDAETRRLAYEGELAAYPSIASSVAACLNGIKGEVNTVSQLRGYSSPLEMTLLHSRMDRQTLDAMLEAIQESLPAFESYFLKKAEILNATQGLPFYDLFAPLGNISTEFSYEDAQKFILEHFYSFSKKLGDYAKNAFENHWIDVYPKEGKRGGAFCSNLHSIRESRILTNFTGTFNDIITLAHELGHGYHGACLDTQTYLNSDYPMPIAETASTFCETLVKQAALKKVSDQEALAILEADLSDNAQVIVDIYSRFLFEDAVIKQRQKGSLSVRELCQLMEQAQKKAYGKGLNPNFLHPYMWLCKSHYYDADYNYYNFPYAFGLLFAKGLYCRYLDSKDTFVSQYDHLLRITGSASLLDVARLMEIDLHSKEFWKSSLDQIEKDIETFLTLS